MADTLHIAVAQINPRVGDTAGNAALLRAARASAAERGAGLLVCGALALSGCPPRDLVLLPAFQAAIRAQVAALAAETADGGPALLVTAPWLQDGLLLDAALLLDKGEIRGLRSRWQVGAEERFGRTAMAGPLEIRGLRLGVTVGADLGQADIVETLQETGAELLLALDAGVFEEGSLHRRTMAAVARVTESGLPLLYANLVGGQDGQVFDGGCFALNADRSLAVQGGFFAAELVSTVWRRGALGWTCDTGTRPAPPEGEAALYRAAMLGLHDHVRKNGLSGVLVAAPDGIAGALSAALAVDALGAERVRVVLLSGAAEAAGARACAAALGLRPEECDIEPEVAALARRLALPADGCADRAAFVLRSRSRAAALAALATAAGALVLDAGGGEGPGGYSPVGDLTPEQMRALARWRNGTRPDGALGPAGATIPEEVLAAPGVAPHPPPDAPQATIVLRHRAAARRRRYPVTNAFAVPS